MAASETEIANLAINHLGAKPIANLDTDRSVEATSIKRVFDTVRDIVLRDFPWPFATKFAALGLVESDPFGDEWSFSYRYPSDAIIIRRILSGIRNDNRQSRISWKQSHDADGLLILTDADDAEVEYTKREEDVSRFPPDFVFAFSFRLASYVAPRITGGDPFGLGTRALRFYSQEIAKASAQTFNEQQDDEIPPSEFVRAREGFRGDLRRGIDFLDFIP